MNDTHYTAEEVRKYADMLGPETRGIKMLRAFAARLEADENAKPVGWVDEHDIRHIRAQPDEELTISADKTGDYDIALFTRPAPASAERLAEDVVYPCANCGATRTKAQGGTVFTVCDECWDKMKTQRPAEPVKVGTQIPSQEWMMRVARSWREADESDELIREDQMLDRVCYVIRSAMRDAQQPAASVPDIDAMVSRFLGWKLPANFSPDAGISFKAEYNEHTPWPARHEPTGTNLFDKDQAREMILHLLGEKCRE